MIVPLMFPPLRIDASEHAFASFLAVRQRAFPERDAAILGPANDGQDAVAFSRRNACRVERLHGDFPGSLAGGLWIRALERKVSSAGNARDLAFVSPGSSTGDFPPGDLAVRFAKNSRRFESDVLAGRLPDVVGGFAIPSCFNNKSTSAEMVFAHNASGGSRPIFPLCRRESGKSAGAAGISTADGTDSAAR